MTIEELRKKNITELPALVLELQKKLSELRFKKSANQIKNTKDTGVIKKDIARALTILQESKTGK